MRGTILDWIRTWLTQGDQCVTVDGTMSSPVDVAEDVPQVTVSSFRKMRFLAAGGGGGKGGYLKRFCSIF